MLMSPSYCVDKAMTHDWAEGTRCQMKESKSRLVQDALNVFHVFTGGHKAIMTSISHSCSDGVLKEHRRVHMLFEA